jgi:site-specific DNA-methyltransferase (adenine-specific)
MKELYFGDCLDILKELYEKYPNGFIDLIYIDPPFNSKRDYSVIFESLEMSDTKAQKQAFADTWTNVSYIDSLNELPKEPLKLLDLYDFLKLISKTSNSNAAYLTTMAIRIAYMRLLLKDSGSFYLHCDSTMGHYLKIVCDYIFGKNNFRNEIVWSYQRWTNSQNQFQKMHDNIFFYSKTKNNDFYIQYEPYSIKSKHKAKRISEIKNNKLSQEYTDDFSRMKALRDVWELSYINSQAKERLGYPTQKPEALLERIIKASSDEGDIVADFFCGCGTTIAVAERLNRQWLGVDISHLAIKLILDRLVKPYPDEKRYEILGSIKINGYPKDIASAKSLAQSVKQGRIKFQDWVIEVMIGGVSNIKKSADGGFDGYMTFPISSKEQGRCLIEVKSGNINVKNLREFIQVINKMEADIGVFVCFEEQLTKPMLQAAKEEGKFKNYSFDKIQILTIEELLAGKNVKLPGGAESSTFKAATKRLDTEPNNNHVLFD